MDRPSSSDVPFPLEGRAPAALWDTHMHLDFDHYEGEQAEIVQRAHQAGVYHIITVGIDADSSARAVELSHRFSSVYAAVGVHPDSAGAWREETAARLREMLAVPSVLALGEIGLDYYHDTDPELQRGVFIHQLELARDLGAPVIIHNRDADEDTVNLVRHVYGQERVEERGRRGVFHCFGGDVDMARECWELGFAVGIGGIVTFHNGEQMQAVAREMPLEALLLETDAPFLSPEPHRGERNEPAHIPAIARRVASLRDEDPVNVADVTSRSARQLFRPPYEAESEPRTGATVSQRGDG